MYLNHYRLIELLSNRVIAIKNRLNFMTASNLEARSLIELSYSSLLFDIIFNFCDSIKIEYDLDDLKLIL